MGDRACPRCSKFFIGSTGQVKCSRCNGSGKVNGQECRKCQGTGHQDCPRCHGSGHIND